MEREIARKAKLRLVYRGVDLSGYCTRVEYTDHADSTLDELRVTLEDRERRWQGAWFPKKSDQVSAQITCHDWFQPGDKLGFGLRGRSRSARSNHRAAR